MGTDSAAVVDIGGGKVAGVEGLVGEALELVGGRAVVLRPRRGPRERNRTSTGPNRLGSGSYK